jgi:hypothetical protein
VTPYEISDASFPVAVCDRVLAVARSIFDQVPVILGGGAVRDLLLGLEPAGVKDWDLFYLGGQSDQLRQAFASFAPAAAQHWDRSAHLIAEIDHLLGPIQIMRTEAETVAEFLAGSDFNVSAFAYDGRIWGPAPAVDFIRPGGSLELGRISNPLSSLARGFSFATRFEMIFESRDVVRLCHFVADSSRDRRRRVRLRNGDKAPY